MTDTIDSIQAAGLNRSQKKFCKMARTHNIRQLAPAGSGKTFSLLWRCRFITDECEKNGSTQVSVKSSAFRDIRLSAKL